MTRTYRLGARQASVDRTARAILDATRRLLVRAPAAEVSVGSIAREAGVSRLTVYQRFGSRSGLFASLVPAHADAGEPDAEPREALRRHFLRGAEVRASSPALYRHLPPASTDGPDAPKRLAEALLAADALRPGCSIREAEDVIGALGSFAVFDRLHRDGRRTPSAVTDVLMRLAAGILA